MPRLKPFWSKKTQELTQILPWEKTITPLFQNDADITKVLRTRKVKLNPTKEQKLL